MADVNCNIILANLALSSTLFSLFSLFFCSSFHLDFCHLKSCLAHIYVNIMCFIILDGIKLLGYTLF